jgi:hypothetical protein
VTIATAVRRYKTEHNLAIGAKLNRLQLATQEPILADILREAEQDLMSITRAQRVEIVERINPEFEKVFSDGKIEAAIGR